MNAKMIPVGRSNFADIRSNDYYYVDKTGLIESLLTNGAVQVTLITRPRRFGKTLNMSMLSEFFDIRRDSRKLFEGLAVAENQMLCREWMNQFPTLFLSFSGVDGLSFERAYGRLKAVISEAYKSHLDLMESPKLSEFDKELFQRIVTKTGADEETDYSLTKLTKMMAHHYGRPVILLIDEYDVPLAKASANGYYPQMLEVMKALLGVFKDNDFLKYAVVTGCLRVAKESIFTGTNNFVSDTITDTQLNRYFGFTQAEVDRLLADAGLTAHRDEMREWYDGYHFGEMDVYCPWDVSNHVRNLNMDDSAEPENFWENTSDNAIVRSILNRPDCDANERFEILMAGGYVAEAISENLTYDMVTSSPENLWSMLYYTGYLTRMREDEVPKGSLMPGQYALRIPNREILEIFKKSVKSWVRDTLVSSDRDGLFEALWKGDAGRLTTLISDLLFDTISYYDYRESFYHAFLTGLVSNAGYSVASNYESGLGRSDLVVKDRKNRRAVVMEAKWAETEAQLDQECERALEQIREKEYARGVERAGYRQVISLGIAFFQKKCLVKAEK